MARYPPLRVGVLWLPKLDRHAILPVKTNLGAGASVDMHGRPNAGTTVSNEVSAIAESLETNRMRGVKSFVIAAALLVSAVLIPKADAQVSITFGAPPSCPYGYYNYAPYACAPPGYYGPGYFYNGIFLGVGPWAYWGYNHGWGSYRFRGPGGGRYHPHSGYYPGRPPKGGYSPYHRPSNHGKPPNHGGRPPNNGGRPPNNGGGDRPPGGGGGGKPPSGGKLPRGNSGGGRPSSGGGNN